MDNFDHFLLTVNAHEQGLLKTERSLLMMLYLHSNDPVFVRRVHIIDERITYLTTVASAVNQRLMWFKHSRDFFNGR